MSYGFKNEKTKNWARGIICEKLTIGLLRIKGYRVLAHRFKSPAGEIDVVAKNRRTLVFVEVKARANETAALEAISSTQRRRIERAALYFVQRHQQYSGYMMRFDAVAFTPMCWPKHVIGAWRAGE